MVAGFHSQQLFLIGLSFGAIAWLGQAAPWSRAWWLGAACAVLALGSMATGFVASAVVIVILSWRVQKKEIPAPTTTATLFFCAAVTAVGWFTRATVTYHDTLKAQNAGDFLLSLVHSLQWPIAVGPWPALTALASLPLWLPWAWVAARAACGCGPAAGRNFTWMLAALGGWVLLQLLATAYARGAGGDPPASRHIDTPAFGAIINGVAAAWLVQT